MGTQFPKEPIFGLDSTNTSNSKSSFQQRMKAEYHLVQNIKKEEKKYTDPSSIPSTPEESYIKDSLTITQIKDYLEQKEDFKEIKSSFDYDLQFSIAQEIDEFFSYTELTRHIDNQKTFLDVCGDWYANSKQESQTILHVWLESLEHADRDRRFRASQCLLYFAQGQFGDHETPTEHINQLIQNNQRLKKLGAIQYYFEALKMASMQHDKLVNLFMNGSTIDTNQMNEINLELSILLSLLYLLIEVNRPREENSKNKDKNKNSISFLEELVSLEPKICPFLFNLISKLKEKSFKGYPIKKVLLLLWKVLVTIYGDLNTFKQLKELQRKNYNLKSKPSKDQPKVKPEEYNLFFYTFSKKYPSCFSELSNLYYTTPPTLAKWTFHSPRILNNNSEQKHYLNNDLMNNNNNSDSPFLLPLTKQHSIAPKPILEAAELFINNLYFPLDFIQLLDVSIDLFDLFNDPETKLPDNFYNNNQKINENENENKNKNENTPTIALNEIQIQEEEEEEEEEDRILKLRLNLIEELYIDLLPESHSIVIVLLKLLLATIPSPQSNSSNNNDNMMMGMQMQKNPFGNKDGELKPPFDTPIHLSADEIDDIRHKEIVAKAISSILLILLKGFKVQHATKFEYYSQMISDSNGILLILKLYGLQDFNTFNKIRNECDHLCFFKALLKPSNKVKDTNKKEEANNLKLPFPPGRNIYTSINFFRILHLLTKEKLARIAMLVQFKSSAILKRVLKVGHPKLNHYIMEIFKSQIPFLGRKWRQNNMKIITQIFLTSTQGLNENWALPYDFGSSIEQQTLSIKQLINGYNQYYYPEIECYTLLMGNPMESNNASNLNDGNKSNMTSMMPVMPQRSYSAHDTNPTTISSNGTTKTVYHSKSVNSLSKFSTKRSIQNTQYYSPTLEREKEMSLINEMKQMNLTKLVAHSGYDNDNLDLDIDFMCNYEDWLELEVFNQMEEKEMIRLNVERREEGKEMEIEKKKGYTPPLSPPLY
ncbi:hypothetical protein K502DRAFT_326417 [Neoconidiobolus thromboides FSU 785]|nr:hypothetical protein K502DRAFT_326417 [Neoconidiobolus thromboides FSU 785]